MFEAKVEANIRRRNSSLVQAYRQPMIGSDLLEWMCMRRRLKPILRNVRSDEILLDAFAFDCYAASILQG